MQEVAIPLSCLLKNSLDFFHKTIESVMYENLLLKHLDPIKGLIVLALVDSCDGSILETVGDESFNIDLAAAEGTHIFNYQRQFINEIEPNDFLESVMISTHHRYHIITPLESNHSLFLYGILDRDHTNLGYAHREIQQLERNLNFYSY